MLSMNANLQALFRVDDNYQLTSWLFLRGVALIYFIAFLSLAVQITGLAGPSGILPFYQALNHAYLEHGWPAVWRTLWIMPTGIKWSTEMSNLPTSY